MDTIGLRELRQDASTFVRRVQEGESFTVTVQGRPAAQLVPVQAPVRRRWLTYDDAADILDHPPLAGLAEDLTGSFDHSVRDPFEDLASAEQPSRA